MMRIIRIGNYDLEQWPRKGWMPPNVRPRVTVYETLGGIKAVVGQGHIGDEIWTLPFDWLDARPAVTVIKEHLATGGGELLSSGQRAAMRIPVAAGDFAAPSAARLHLWDSSGASAGRLSLEVWTGTGDLPDTKVGWIASVDCASLSATGYAELDLWGMAALPVNGDGSIVAWLVLTADAMTAGQVAWRCDDPGSGNNSARYVDGEWIVSTLDLDGTVWQGGQYQVLRGFEAAYDGGHEWILDLGGPLYRVIVDEVTGGLQLPPLSLDSEEAMSDEVEIRLTVLGVT
jgi:hypothetical protein